MKYLGKEYKWFSITFENGKPDGVILFKNNPYGYRGYDGSITTYWDNEKLTEKPIIK